MNENTFELLADLKSMRATIRVMDENKKGYLERIASLDAELAKAKQLPEGYVLVPIRPTAAMIDAGNGVDDLYKRGTTNTWGEVYRAMIAAAPKP